MDARNRKIAVYPGSFDPVTNGHLDILNRSRLLFDRVIVAVSANPGKGFLFTADERVQMIQEVVGPTSEVLVESFTGLLVDYASKKEVSFVIRGLRALSDFEYELQMHLMNRKLDPGTHMLYLMTDQRYSYLSSSVIKEISQLGGDLRGLVPKTVEEHLKRKFR